VLSIVFWDKNLAKHEVTEIKNMQAEHAKPAEMEKKLSLEVARAFG
jgi:hypothetical protein